MYFKKNHLALILESSCQLTDCKWDSKSMLHLMICTEIISYLIESLLTVLHCYQVILINIHNEVAAVCGI